MGELKKAKENGKEQTSLPLTVIKTDVNLAQLPFFVLSHGELDDFQVELIITEVRDNEKLELYWSVIPSAKYGYPGAFAKDVHRALEYLLTRNGFPVQEYIDFSFYEIADILKIEPSGRTCSNIKQALLTIKFAGIESKGTYRYLDNGKKRWVEDYFNLYNRVIFVGEGLSDGTIAEANRIYFNEWYLKSLNSLYIKPLDFKYWRNLRSKIAGRLYEYLSYISFATKCRPFSIKYHRLCKFLPIKPQQYFSLAKQVLFKPHKELIQTGFLKKVAWRESKTESKEWVIVYHFGERAKQEYKRGFQDDSYRPAVLAIETAKMLPEVEEELREKKKKSTQKEKEDSSLPEELSDLVSELEKRNITKRAAKRLVNFFSEEHIREKIKMFDYLRKTRSYLISRNPAGWLRSAIEDDYKLEDFEEKLKIREAEESKKELFAKAEETREQRIEEAVTNFPKEDEWVQKRIDRAVDSRNELAKYMPGRHPYTEEEIFKMRKEFVQEYPETEEERRDWLKYQSEYRIDWIVKELRA